MAKQFPHEISELPTGEAFIILTPTSVYIEGDQRSRDCPGHGYPAHSEDYWNLEVFETEEEWKSEILKRQTSKYGNKNFKAYRATPAKINVNVTVD